MDTEQFDELKTLAENNLREISLLKLRINAIEKEFVKPKHKAISGDIIEGDVDSQTFFNYKAWRDLRTNLIWEIKPADNKSITYTSDEADEYVEFLNEIKYAGILTWRLPKMIELKSLLTDKANDGIYIRNPMHNNIGDIQYYLSWEGECLDFSSKEIDDYSDEYPIICVSNGTDISYG